MKKTIKFFLKIIILSFILGFLIIQFLISDFNNPFDESKLSLLKAQIENSESLPSDFINVFNQINPITNTNGILYDGLKEKYNSRSCPCLNIARSNFNISNSRIMGNHYILAWKLEKEFTQEQCLNYYTKNYDFHYQNTGIENASKYYFNKQLTELNEEEISILTLTLWNSALYNPKKNMQGIKEKLLELKN